MHDAWEKCRTVVALPRDLLTLSHYDLVLSSTIYGFGYSHNTQKVKGKQPENLRVEQSNTLGKISFWGCLLE